MKRFLVFAGDAYYPSGGWKDFKGDHDTIEQARTFCDQPEEWGADDFKYGSTCAWVHIVDTLSSEPTIVWRRENDKESK